MGRKTHGDTLAGISTLNEDEALSLLDSLVDPFLLILDQVQDPRNFGACLRSADAAGVNLVIMPSDRSAGRPAWYGHVAAEARRKLYRSREWVTLPDSWVCSRSIPFFWLVRAIKFNHTLYETELTGPLGLVVGAEGAGIRRLTASQCDQLVSVPMFGEVDCLNVSVATGVCLLKRSDSVSFDSSRS